MTWNCYLQQDVQEVAGVWSIAFRLWYDIVRWNKRTRINNRRPLRACAVGRLRWLAWRELQFQVGIWDWGRVKHIRVSVCRHRIMFCSSSVNPDNTLYIVKVSVRSQVWLELKSGCKFTSLFVSVPADCDEDEIVGKELRGFPWTKWGFSFFLLFLCRRRRGWDCSSCTCIANKMRRFPKSGLRERRDSVSEA